MKLTTVLSLPLLFTLVNPIAQAQISQIQHVIVVVQENRTPDNLFATYQTLIDNGADIQNINTPVPCENHSPVPLMGENLLGVCWDPDHSHSPGWTGNYDGGAMDGACQNNVTVPTGCSITGVPYPADTYTNNYVSGSYGILQPYFDIAANYGFANYMFQTNQGPSFEAHQFLFSGTSAPDFYNDPNTNCGSGTPCYEWFAGELPKLNGTYSSYSGCPAPAGTTVKDINPQGGSESYVVPPTGFPAGFPCYTHASMADLLDAGTVSWKYYTPPGTSGKQGTTIWTAPNALSGICEPVTGTGTGGNTCGGSEWLKDVVLSPRQTGPNTYDYAPFLTDISYPNCALPAVSWVIPDGSWSDHPSPQAGLSDGGPSWVAAIVNAIGGGTSHPSCNYWNNTVILITWDDWGGWYDHISPSAAQNGPGAAGYPNTSNPINGQFYVYGFRVPLLVVSAYGTVVPGQTGYISGSTLLKGGGEKPPYLHDFGSILGFIETVFGLPYGTIGNLNFPYADYFAPDGPNGLNCKGCSPLSDFFNFQATATTFVPITTAKYPPSCFHTPSSPGCFGADYQPTDPDDDGID